MLLRVEYDGTDFAGFQAQADERTVQETLEDSVFAVTGERLRLIASSRTDAGVHARALPVVFRTQAKIPLHGLLRALNARLPPDCAVTGIAEVSDAFEVRRWALGKVYRYSVWNSRIRSALNHRTAWHVPMPLDLDAMRRAAAPLVGLHDFSSYRASGCQALSPVRHVTAIEISGESGGAVDLVFHGNAFLQNMIRILSGTLVEVGRGWRSEASPAEVLAARDRRLAGQTAPGHGLRLERVLYEPPVVWYEDWPSPQRASLSSSQSGGPGSSLAAPAATAGAGSPGDP